MTGIVAIILARLFREHESPSRIAVAGWYGAGAVFLGFGLFDGLGFPAGLQMPVVVAGVALTTIVLLLCYRSLPPAGLSRRLILLGGFLIVLNPVFEWLEIGMMSDPSSYFFVAADRPYQFNADAWSHLWIVSRSQELTETGSMICLLAGFLMYGELLVGDNAARVGRARIPNGG